MTSGQPAGRPTIGVLVDSVKDMYQSALFAGLVDAARTRDVNLTVFAGGILGAPANEGVYRNFVFDLCTARNVDGVVLVAGAIGNHLGAPAVEALARRLSPLPLASLALALPGIPSVLLDEEAGMRQALEHLVVRHGCRRIAFIRGPSVNAEAERRYALYRAVLEEQGVALDPALICDGTFNKGAGAAAIKTLLDDRGADFDAVVASNDIMAMAAMAALQERGIEVPSDVAVIGFDDLEAARFAAPPLTTVRQPLNQQVATALDLVLAQIAGQQPPEQTLTAAELVVRRSCGCLSGSGSSLPRPGRSGPVTRTAMTVDTLLSEHGDALRAQMVQSVHGADAALAAGWDAQLLGAFQAELRGASAGLFSAMLDGLLTAAARAGDDVAAWNGVVSTLRRLVLPALTGDPSRWLLAEDLWHEARVSIGTFAEGAQAQHRLNLQSLARSLAESSATLLAIHDVPLLLRALADQFPRLDIPGAWVALFEDAGRQSARLALAYDELDPSGKPVSLPERDPPPFTAEELIPAAARPLGRRLSVAVEPLFFNARPLGFLVLELGPQEGLLYASLAEQVSSALEGARLLAQLGDRSTRRP
ncbi:MAG TPA: substrate-binding domain-containing protein [Polyangia bacterium]|nr:substrate-binding domain-containing protein [Polyangia bacterium]